MTKQSETPKRGMGWIWWVIFPPYALYRLIRSTAKWYIKVPVFALFLLITLLAFDLSASPHRVEDAKAEDEISSFLKKKGMGVSALHVERLGEGQSVIEKDVQPLVYYRAISEGQLFQFGLASKDGKDLAVEHVEQLYPIRMGIEADEGRTKAEVAIWLQDNEEKIGKIMEFISESEDGLEQVVKTSKMELNFKIGNQSIYEVKNEKGKILFEKENEIVLPDEVQDYLKENKDKIGTLERSLGYEIHGEKEMYYFRTTTGEFVAEFSPDGTVELKKKR